MKSSIKLFASIALIFTFCFVANAQRGGQKLSPEEMAEKETTQMVEKLNLDEVQTVKIKEINLTFAKKKQEAKDENKGNKEAIKVITEAINNEKIAEVKQILTDEQFKDYEALIAKSTTRKKGRGGRGGGRGGK